MKVGKKLCKLITAGMHSYAYAKITEKTGMAIPEIMLMKDGYKTCVRYYSKNLSVFLRAVFGKKKPKPKLVKTSEIDPALRAKIKDIIAQPKPVPIHVTTDNPVTTVLSKKSLFEGTHLQHE